MLSIFKTRWIEFVTLLFFGFSFCIASVYFPFTQASLIGFSVGSVVYITLVSIIFAPLDHKSLSQQITFFDRGHLTVMVVAWLAIFGVLGGICIFMTFGEKSYSEVIISTIAITIAWALFHFIGAIHYANIQYGGQGPDKIALEYPCGKPGLFLDLLYFSFTVGMGFGTSDVSIITTQMRMIVLIHAIFSFLFNLFVFAVAVAGVSSLL